MVAVVPTLLGSMMMAPHMSVRYVVTPALRSVASVVAAGCPNRLCRPTLMIAYRGWTAAMKPGADEYADPWWPTLRTSVMFTVYSLCHCYRGR